MPTIKLPTWSIVLDALRKVAPMAVVLSERGVGLRVDQLGQKLDFTQNLTRATDALALVRRHLWLASEGFSLSAAGPDIQELPVALYQPLADSLAHAA